MTAAVVPISTLEPDWLWSSPELQHSACWRRCLPDGVRDELLAFVAGAPETAAADFTWRPAEWPRLSAFADEVRAELEAGCGLVVLHGLAELGLSEEQQRCFYTAYGCALGSPMLQYGRLYPVVDRGGSYEKQAIPVSMTNAETRFHTDSSSVDVVPDFVGLLCEQPSNQGGESLVSNAVRAYHQLRERAPELAALLERPLIRDVVTPGREKNLANLLRNRFPVFQLCDRPGGVLFRYMRYWIEKGQRRAEQPLCERQLAALDLLDELLEAPDNVLRFQLERGEILWVNNRRLAHNRTAYQDTPDNVRQLQRMWVETAPR